MPINVDCPNGHRLVAQDALRGKRLRCPKCQAIVSIPPIDDPLGVGNLAGNLGGFPAIPASAGFGVSARRARRRPGWLLPAAISAGVAVVVLGIVAGVVIGKRKPAFQEVSQAADANASLHGPAFPDAVSALPDWLIADAPFDVATFFAAPPADDNAAYLYVDALYEFRPEMEVYFPAEIRAQRTPIVRARKDRAEAFSRASTAPQAVVDLAERDALIQDHAVGMEKIIAAQQRQRCAFPWGMSYADRLPLIGAAIHSTQMFRLQAERDLAKGDVASVLRLLEAALRYSRDLRYRSSGDIQATASILDSMFLQFIARPILSSPAVTAADCDRLLATLDQHDAALQAIDPILTGLRGDYVLHRVLLHDIEHREGEFSEARFRTAFGGRHATFAQAVRYAIRGDLTAFGVEATAQVEKESLLEIMEGLKAADYQREREWLDEMYQALAPAAREPYNGLADAAAKLAPPAPPIQPARLLAIAFYGGWRSLIEAGLLQWPDPRAFAQLQGCRALAALRRWRFTQQAPPANLAALFPGVATARLPRDTYGGGPLRMVTFATETALQDPRLPDAKARAGETIFYSVGRDGRDDRGLKHAEYAFDGDVLFYLDP